MGGASVAFVAALLTIVDRILSLKERLRTTKSHRQVVKLHEESPAEWSADCHGMLARSRWTTHSPFSYLFYREIFIIGGAGILLNYLGLALSLQLESFLFLDMTGTALVAFLLGPWWGASVALLSSSAINWLLYPDPSADVLIFPWALVNMAGGLFWGFVASGAHFQRYLSAGHNSVISHLWFLAILGVLGAIVMSIPGTFVTAAIAAQTEVSLQSSVLRALGSLVAGWQSILQAYLEPLLGGKWAEGLGWGIVHWLQNCVRYIPDKTLSVAIALVVLKYGFPLFEQELIHGGPAGKRPKDSYAAPLFLGLLYVPPLIALLSADMFSGNRYWPLWSAPWLIIAPGLIFHLFRGPAKAEFQAARLGRAERYAYALKPIEQEPSYQFCRRLTLATLVASALIALCFPILLPDYGTVAFNFFCVVYGFLLAMHLLHVAISQNLALARAGGFATLDLGARENLTTRSRAKHSAGR